MRRNHKIEISMLCFIVLLLDVVGCQAQKKTPQEMSDDELRIAVLSEMNLREMWYYSNEDYSLNIPIGISLMAEKYPVFQEAVERDVFDGVDGIAMRELLGDRECVATEEERETFLTEYQGWKESFGGKFVDSEILEPYRTLLDVEWKRDTETGGMSIRSMRNQRSGLCLQNQEREQCVEFHNRCWRILRMMN